MKLNTNKSINQNKEQRDNSMYYFDVYTTKKKYKLLDGYKVKGESRYSVIAHLVRKFARKVVSDNGKTLYMPIYSFDELKTALYRGYIRIEFNLSKLKGE